MKRRIAIVALSQQAFPCAPNSLGPPRDWFRNNQSVKEQGYVTQLLGKDAVRLIESHDPKTPVRTHC